MAPQSKPRYLTKSRFKLATECPTKLFYTGKNELYLDQSLEVSFLAALAEGGFQVGELTKCYFPNGHEIETLEHAAALKETAEWLQQKDVTIYEAATVFENLFIRADVLVKRGQHLDLIEVKAKSFDPEEDDFFTKKGGITSEWKPYLFDVAFQKHVLSQAFPHFKIQAYLMLADKTAECVTDGLNQKFRISSDPGNRKRAILTKPLTKEELANQILCQLNVDSVCDLIYTQSFDSEVGPADFVERVKWFAENYAQDETIITPPSSVCAGCQFQTNAEDELAGLKSGFKECWVRAFKWRDSDFEASNILNIWNWRKKNLLIGERRIKMSDVVASDINPAKDGKPGLSASERQWLQVEKAQQNDDTPYLEKAALKRAMKTWKFPLHFIDFETTTAAIPFNRGWHPYETVAFQFSHHVVHQDGRIEHKGEYLNDQPGVFPNFDFLRALKKELEQDEGSIFRYSHHENTVLNHVARQLQDYDKTMPDCGELQSFVCSITNSTKSRVDGWVGKRSMIDLCELVKRFYYAPQTRGSNSIKEVLPYTALSLPVHFGNGLLRARVRTLRRADHASSTTFHPAASARA